MGAGSDVDGMELLLKIVWDTLFFAIIGVAVVGNVIVLWIILGKKSCFSRIF